MHELYVMAAGVGSAEASATRRMADRPNNNDNNNNDIYIYNNNIDTK